MPTILLVEDEANQRLLYQMELEDEGYHVVAAGNGREALQEAQRTRPDLVVLDLRMPGMDGLEALQRMMALNQSLPVIIHSAYETYKDNFITWAADACKALS
jgi:CheY-like chemotaxis protein